MKFIERLNRTLVKVISWRVVITASNFLLTYFLTGSWQTGLAFVGLATVVNTIVYALHERGWNRIQWGKTIKE
jgi:uncharacterized membrane protein